jgi:hypothetical protein
LADYEVDYKLELVLDRRNSNAQQQRPYTDRWSEQISLVENRGAEESVLSDQGGFALGQRPLPDSCTVSDVSEKVMNMDLNMSNFSENIYNDTDASKDAKLCYRSTNDDVPQANENADVNVSKTEDPTHHLDTIKDYQAEYMSKLAKERAEKLRLEEEARMVALKERAAMRLRVLEEKRLEERKRLLSIRSQDRKEFSRPSSQFVLEPLGKTKKENPSAVLPRPTVTTQQAEKKDDRQTLYNPDRSFSSLVGGKSMKNIAGKTANEDVPWGDEKQSPVHGPSMSTPGKYSGKASIDNEMDDSSKPFHMVQLSNLDELDRGGRGEGQGGRRMLFDPNSGSMVAVPSREDPKPAKKAKQKTPQKGPFKSSDEEIANRRAIDDFTVENPDVKQMPGRQGRCSSRKDDSIPLLQINKKQANKGKQTPRKRIPRTRGVLYKITTGGNYLNVDECEPDEGYGAYLVPGGKIKNPSAHAKFGEQQAVERTEIQPIPSTTTGFSFRDDPGFIQHQTNFEAQQQKILEDAWATLVENDEPVAVEPDEVVKVELPASKSGDDEYVAALEISPSIIGLNFDAIDSMESVLLPPSVKTNGNHSEDEPIDLTTKFAMATTGSAIVTNTSNPFLGPLGVSGASLWGANKPGISSTSYDLSALTGWTPTPFGETESTLLTGTVGLNSSSSQSSKLHLWGSSLDDSGLGAFSNHGDMQNGAD